MQQKPVLRSEALIATTTIIPITPSPVINEMVVIALHRPLGVRT